MTPSAKSAPGADIEQMIVTAIDAATSVQPEGIVLFGSRARGDNQPDSDWDVLVLMPDDAPNFEDDRIAIRKAMTPLFESLGVPVRPIAIRWKDLNASAGIYQAALNEGRRLA